jgi:hypothetical protein
MNRRNTTPTSEDSPSTASYVPLHVRWFSISRTVCVSPRDAPVPPFTLFKTKRGYSLLDSTLRPIQHMDVTHWVFSHLTIDDINVEMGPSRSFYVVSGKYHVVVDFNALESCVRDENPIPDFDNFIDLARCGIWQIHDYAPICITPTVPKPGVNISFDLCSWWNPPDMTRGQKNASIAIVSAYHRIIKNTSKVVVKRHGVMSIFGNRKDGDGPTLWVDTIRQEVSANTSSVTATLSPKGVILTNRRGTGKTLIAAGSVHVFSAFVRVRVLIVCPDHMCSHWEKAMQTHTEFSPYTIETWKSCSHSNIEASLCAICPWSVLFGSMKKKKRHGTENLADAAAVTSDFLRLVTKGWTHMIVDEVGKLPRTAAHSGGFDAFVSGIPDDVFRIMLCPKDEAVGPGAKTYERLACSLGICHREGENTPDRLSTAALSHPTTLYAMSEIMSTASIDSADTKWMEKKVFENIASNFVNIEQNATEYSRYTQSTCQNITECIIDGGIESTIRHDLFVWGHSLEDMARFGNKQEVNTDDKCPICMERPKYIATTPCGHIFCVQCIATSVICTGTCPMCRRSAPRIMCMDKSPLSLQRKRKLETPPPTGPPKTKRRLSLMAPSRGNDHLTVNHDDHRLTTTDNPPPTDNHHDDHHLTTTDNPPPTDNHHDDYLTEDECSDQQFEMSTCDGGPHQVLYDTVHQNVIGTKVKILARKLATDFKDKKVVVVCKTSDAFSSFSKSFRDNKIAFTKGTEKLCLQKFMSTHNVLLTKPSCIMYGAHVPTDIVIFTSPQHNKDSEKQILSMCSGLDFSPHVYVLMHPNTQDDDAVSHGTMFDNGRPRISWDGPPVTAQ